MPPTRDLSTSPHTGALSRTAQRTCGGHVTSWAAHRSPEGWPGGILLEEARTRNNARQDSAAAVWAPWLFLGLNSIMHPRGHSVHPHLWKI